jgi:catechol 2,3-dioxygenase-like lactoylglutathione lyase family enzyme
MSTSSLRPHEGPPQLADNIDGIDHVVVSVHDLEQAAAIWRRLGFTLAPKGVHSHHVGTANYTMMLTDDYIELLGVLTPTENNISTRNYLAIREGLDRAAFATRDAATGVAALRAAGIDGTGPLDFSRPVALADGTPTEARFRTFAWPRDQRPGNVRLFACQHLTRSAVWQPRLMQRANTAIRLQGIDVVSKDPKRAAEDMQKLTGLKVLELGLSDKGYTIFSVHTGADRTGSACPHAPYNFMSHDALAKRFAGLPLGKLPEEGAMCLSITVQDIAAARAAIGASAVELGPQRIAVPPDVAHGVILEFEEGDRIADRGRIN